MNVDPLLCLICMTGLLTACSGTDDVCYSRVDLDVTASIELQNAGFLREYLCKSPFWRLRPEESGFIAVSRPELGKYLNLPSQVSCSAVVEIDRNVCDNEVLKPITFPRKVPMRKQKDASDVVYHSVLVISIGEHIRLTVYQSGQSLSCEESTRLASSLLNVAFFKETGKRMTDQIEEETEYMMSYHKCHEMPVFQFIPASMAIPGEAFGFVNFGDCGILEIKCVCVDNMTMSNDMKSFRTKELVGGSMLNNERFFYSTELCVDGDGGWHDAMIQLMFTPLATGKETLIWSTNSWIQTWRR